MVKPDAHHFQALSLTNTEKGIHGLTDATLSLWKQGLRVSFWGHHPLQTTEYATLLLPPYQFDKVRHWMELKSPLKAITEAAAAMAATAGPVVIQPQQSVDERLLGLWSLTAYEQNESPKKARFRINTGSDKYKKYISGHLIAQTAPICPATLQVDMAIESLFSLNPHWTASSMQPVVLDMSNHSPLCVDPTKTTWLEFDSLNDSASVWAWKIFSTSSTGSNETHVEAKLHIRSPDEAAYQTEFGRFERLVTHSQCTAVLNLPDDDDVDILQGRNVYPAFSDVVDYGELYRGVRRVVGRAGECAGRVVTKHNGESWLDVPLSDSFSQVGGLYINCMTDRPASDMFIATGCEMAMRSPRMARLGKDEVPGSWHVLTRHHRQGEKVYTSDVFVFNATTGMLTELMIGITFARVAKASMSKMLTRLTGDESVLKIKPSQAQAALTTTVAAPVPFHPTQQPQVLDKSATETSASQKTSSQKKGTESGVSAVKPSRPDVTNDLRNLVANISGVEPHEIELDTEMAELGIDSLMGMEVAREVESVFKCTLDQTELMEATSLRKFVVCLNNALYGPGYDNAADESVGTDKDDDFSSQGASDNTPTGTGATTPSVPDIKPNAIHDVPSVKPAATATVAPPVETSLKIASSAILKAFGDVKMFTDQEIRSFKLDRIHRAVLAGSNRLCTALVVEQFEKLGCELRAASPGQVLNRVPFQPQHERLMEFVYKFLEKDTRLIDIDEFTGQITRTSIPVPRKASGAIFAELLQAFPEFAVANKLTNYAGNHLADVLTGKTDGIRVIFGSLEGRDLVQSLYLDHSFNRMQYGQMRDIIQHLTQMLPRDQGPLKILEVGAGTGGTTCVLAPMLASLGFPVEYTFTDISPSMVANAKRKLNKEYPFMRFAVHDIERPPAGELVGHHLVIGSNAVHATHNLVTSLANVRKALRPDGFLMMLEMTESAPFIDLIFGLLEGWWLFDDGRKQAIVSAEHWERDLHASGFGHVDWTDGSLPENRYQKVIIALASGTQSERLPCPMPEDACEPAQGLRDVVAHEAEANRLMSKHIDAFAAPRLLCSGKTQGAILRDGHDAVVLVTGATGSLGSHVVARFAEEAAVKTVVCVNRKTGTPVTQRQAEAFSSRAKLGLPAEEYAWLAHNVTLIVYNAWPMSGTRPVKAFEQQFQALRNLLDLARDIADTRGHDSGFRVGFQLVSSIGVVGEAGKARVPEDRVPFSATLLWAIARPNRFRTMVVRPGQIAGSRKSGFWKPIEHFAFLVKSAQTLRAWPDFDGVLQWTPVDAAAGVLVDLCRVAQLHNAPEPYPVYHVDNPVGQPWKEMNLVLADALGIPAEGIVPFRYWVDMVRRSPLPAETDNPAARLMTF
ncbi:putative secondary metabolism biosynthetic enzyme [Metarhizium acridum]|nr:putative secondary metabolism biosynthetic enzyme [Metarhizium acridum]